MEKYQIAIATLIGIIGVSAIMMNLEKEQTKTYIPEIMNQYETQSAIYDESPKVRDVLNARRGLLRDIE